MATAIARSLSGRASTAASAASGRRTVRDWTIESYCSNAHRFDATFGDASSARSTSVPSARGSSDSRLP